METSNTHSSRDAAIRIQRRQNRERGAQPECTLVYQFPDGRWDACDEHSWIGENLIAGGTSAHYDHQKPVHIERIALRGKGLLTF